MRRNLGIDWKMKLGVTAHRKITKNDEKIIRRKIRNEISNNNVEELFLGGALGGDDISLQEALSIDARDYVIIVILPDTIKQAPKGCKDFILKADKIIELKNPIRRYDGFKAYTVRDQFIANIIDRLLGFWDGITTKSGTYRTISYAKSIGKDCDITKIEGLRKN